MPHRYNCQLDSQNAGFGHFWDLRFQTFSGGCPRTPNHSVRTWNYESRQVKVCPGPPNFPDCCAVYVRFGIFEYEL